MPVKDVFPSSFRVISDVHLESRESIPKDIWPDSTDKVRNIILAGDIGDPYKKLYKDFLLEARKRYDNVLVVPGNREYYNIEFEKKEVEEKDSIPRNRENEERLNAERTDRDKIKTISQVNLRIEKLCKETKCVFLNRNFFETGNTVILGCVLWNTIPSYVKPSVVVHGFSPLKYIHLNSSPITIPEYQNLHFQDKEWLRREIQKHQNKNIVIVTHYPPTSDFSQPRKHEDILAKLFENEMDDFVCREIKAWVCGHSHHSKAFRKNDVIMCSNTVGSGYQTDSYSNYNKNFCLSV